MTEIKIEDFNRDGVNYSLQIGKAWKIQILLVDKDSWGFTIYKGEKVFYTELGGTLEETVKRLNSTIDQMHRVYFQKLFDSNLVNTLNNVG